MLEKIQNINIKNIIKPQIENCNNLWSCSMLKDTFSFSEKNVNKNVSVPINYGYNVKPQISLISFGSKEKKEEIIFQTKEDVFEVFNLNRKNRKIFARIIEQKGEYTHTDKDGNCYLIIKDKTKKEYRIKIIKKALAKPTTRYNCDHLSQAELLAQITSSMSNKKLVGLINVEAVTGNLNNNHLKLIYEAVKDAEILYSENERKSLSALKDYKKGQIYKQINGKLRDPNFVVSDEYKKQIAIDIKRLEEFINSCTSGISGVKLYRTDDYAALSSTLLDGNMMEGQSLSSVLEKAEQEIKKGKDVDLEEINKAAKNKEVVFLGFFSTSLTEKAANTFGRNERPVIWNLTTKENIPGTFIDAFKNDEFSYVELEYLIQRGAKIKINEIKYKNNRWHIDADVISVLNK